MEPTRGRIARRFFAWISVSQESPLVSIVIPTRDRPESLERALNSVLDQRVTSIEVLIVDDGSETPLNELYKPSDSRVRVVRQETPSGPAAARECGVQQARGTFIAFLDDDDTWLPGKLAICLDAFVQYPEAGAVFHATGEPHQARDRSVLLERPVERMLLEQPPHLDGLVVRRAVHDEVRFDPLFVAAEDLDYLIRLASVTKLVEIHGTYASAGKNADSHVGIRARIDGRILLKQKHSHLFDDPRASAFWYLRLGHLYQRAGDRFNSLNAFGKSALLNPTDMRSWRGIGLSLIPRRVIRVFMK